MDDFKIVLDRIAEYHVGKEYTGPIHLHGYGEPLLDKNLPEKVKLAKLRYPKSPSHIVTTLGHNVSDEYLEQLVSNGLRSMSVSFFGSVPDTYQFHTKTGDYYLAYRNLLKIIEAKEKINKKFGIMVKTSLSGLKTPKDSATEAFNAMLTSLGVRVMSFPLHNYGDGRNYKKSRKLLCRTLIKRNVLQVTWDMKVIPCCYDYNAELVYGDLRTHSIKQIFESDQMQGYLKNHCEGNADIYSPCKNCTDRNMRDTD